MGRGFSAPTDVVLAPDTAVQPHLVFIRRERYAILTGENIQGPPDLAIEILPPATRERDLGAKRQLYARFGESHFWIVDPQSQSVARVLLDDDPHYGDPTTVTAGGWLAFSFGSLPMLAVATIFG